MKSNSRLLGSIGLFLFISLLGCNFLAPAPSGSGPSPEPQPGISGNCNNPFLPVVVRATWDYSSTGSSMGDYSFSHQVGNVRADGFTMEVEYSTGVLASQEWSCAGGALAVLDAGGGPAGGLSTYNGVTSSIDTDDINGYTLPATINIGDIWQQNLNMDGTVRLPDGREGSATGTYTASFQAMGSENVTVPAGSFNAMRIDAITTYDLMVIVEGLEVPITTGVTQQLWYSPGVGLVQSLSTSDIMGDEAIVLTHYNIP